MHDPDHGSEHGRTSGRSSGRPARRVQRQRSTARRRSTGCGRPVGHRRVRHIASRSRSLSRQINAAQASTASAAKSHADPHRSLRRPRHRHRHGRSRAGQPPAVEPARDLPWRAEVGRTLRGLPAVVEALAEDQPASCRGSCVTVAVRVVRVRCTSTVGGARRGAGAASAVLQRSCRTIRSTSIPVSSPAAVVRRCAPAARCSVRRVAGPHVDRLAREQLGDGRPGSTVTARGRPSSATRSVRQSGAGGGTAVAERSKAPRSR